MHYTHAMLDEQRYSCRQCGWCCRWWRVQVDPADRDRILRTDWAQESPRLRGVRLFEEQMLPGQFAPSVYLARLDGQCVFLEADNLCIIHRALGPEAKPASCRRFPFIPGWIGRELVVGADYSCPSLVMNEGEPVRLQERLMPDWLSRGGGLRPLPEPEVALTPGVCVRWPAYLVVENCLISLFGQRCIPVEDRFENAVEMITFLSARATLSGFETEDGVQLGIEERMQQRCERLTIETRDQSLLPTWSSLAPFIGDMETPHTSINWRGTGAIGYAVAIASGVGKLYLSTLRATVELSQVREVRVTDLSPEVDDCLTRWLCNYLKRKSLLKSPHLKEGIEYLLRCFGLVCWYSAASASLRGRSVAEIDDVVLGIQVVEKAYVP